MAIEMLTYAALAERLKISPEAARALAKRLRNGLGRMTEKRS
jgi:DNA-binding Lrp family transcriptional regulator